LLSAGQITFATITAGPVLAVALWFVTTRACGSLFVPHATVIGLVGNAVTAVPIVCLLWNIIAYGAILSFLPKVAGIHQTFMDISGNEVTIFIALTYAALALGSATLKSIRDCKKDLDGISPTSESAN
jgi:hypothetical protein